MASDEQSPEEALRELELRLHIFEGWVRVLDDPRGFMDLVLAEADPFTAQSALREVWGLTEVQAQAAMDLQVRRFSDKDRMWTRTEVVKMRAEHQRLTGQT